jgi:hypothetical protein
VEESASVESQAGEKPSEQANELGAVTTLLSLLSKFDPQTRERILQTAATFFGIGGARLQGLSGRAPASVPLHAMTGDEFSQDRSISPKQFMVEKQPKTDVEKVACLAYYLTHYRDTPHFKTLDISKLNTDAAQVKFSNPTVAVENAVKTHYLVPATKGNKQLGSMGEQFVQALPDREKARAIMTTARPRRRSRKDEPISGEEPGDLEEQFEKN